MSSPAMVSRSDDLAAAAWREAASTWRSPPTVPLSVWMDEHFVLPDGSGWKTLPFQRGIADAIRALVAQLRTDDPISRLSATRQLAAEHGEYAVPYLVPALADAGDEDRRVQGEHPGDSQEAAHAGPRLHGRDGPRCAPADRRGPG